MISARPRLSYRIREVAEATGLCAGTVSRMVREGKLPATRVGRAILIPADAVEAMVAGHAAQTSAEPVPVSRAALDVVTRLLS